MTILTFEHILCNTWVLFHKYRLILSNLKMLLHQRIERVNIAVRIGTLRRRGFVSGVERGIIASVVRLYGKRAGNNCTRDVLQSILWRYCRWPLGQGVLDEPMEAATYFTGMDRLVEPAECTRAGASTADENGRYWWRFRTLGRIPMVLVLCMQPEALTMLAKTPRMRPSRPDLPSG